MQKWAKYKNQVPCNNKHFHTNPKILEECSVRDMPCIPTLRIPDIHEAQNTNFLRFVWYFYQATLYKKSEWYFFDQWSRGGKNEVKVKKCHLVAKLKLKMLNMQKVTFSISTPPPGGTFKLLLHFPYLWNIAKKSIIRIFDVLSIKKLHWNFAPCISGILKTDILIST